MSMDWVHDPGGLASVMDGDAGIVTSIGFPWGLRCADCHEEIPEGTAYVSYRVQTECTDPDHVHAVIICCGCAVERSMRGGEG